jgi:hypothetical protein
MFLWKNPVGIFETSVVAAAQLTAFSSAILKSEDFFFQDPLNHQPLKYINNKIDDMQDDRRV